MLINRQDAIAAEFSHYYTENAEFALLEFAIKNSNSLFIKHAFRQLVFPSSYLNTGKEIKIILGILEQGKTEIILNCLIFADF